MNQCIAIRANGERCRAMALPERTHCFAHDEANRQRANEARRRGGHGKANTARARKAMGADLHDIAKLLEDAMRDVAKGTMLPQQGSALASLAGAWVRLHEMAEVEQRISELEARLEARPGAAGWRR